MKRQDLTERNTTHGLSHLPEYSLWCGMKQRCYYEKHKSFKDYGAKGIKVSDEWHDFEKFYNDMGSKPEGMTLDRIDTNKDYSKDNCRWATYKEQMRNTSRNNIIEFNGKSMCLTDWAKELNVSYSVLKMRLFRGWDLERALS